MRVAAVQMRSGTGVAANIAQASGLIRAAAGEGAEFVTTPEMTNMVVRGREALEARLAAEADDASVAAFSGLARELGLHLLIGSLAVRDGARIRNRSYLFGPSGDVLARYDKMHMFDANVGVNDRWRESATYAAGDAPITADVGEAKLGLGICYDLRFAELFRHYAREGCEIITVPAAFTVPTGQAHWKVLLRARAIETGCFMIAPAQGGLHEDGRETYGHSLIVAPWGEVVAEMDGDAPGYIVAEIDLDEVRQARARVPAWSQSPKV